MATTTLPPKAEPAPEPVNEITPGFKFLLEGQTGTGKTHAIRTLLDLDLEVFVLATEPGIHAVLGDTDPDQLHWHYVSPKADGMSEMEKRAQKILKSTYEDLAKEKPNAAAKREFDQFLRMISSCSNFPCDRTGKRYGAVDSWMTDRVFVLDTLTGVSKMAMSLVVGSKPTKSEGEWGVAMDQVEHFIDLFTCGTMCHFILNAHLGREKDEITGSMKHYPMTLGQKLPPKIPTNFDEVVLAERTKDSWKWSTNDRQADLKFRYMPNSNNIEPHYKVCFEGWKKKGGIVIPTEVALAS